MAGILFAGGCHVEGWPIGSEHSFVRVALGLMASEASLEPHILSYINFKTASDRIAEACLETGSEYLVLQLGHYETAPVFSKILRKLLLHRTGRKCKIDAFSEGGSPEQEYRPTVRIRLFNCRRMLLSGALAALGARRRIFDPDGLFEDLDSILTDLAALHLKKVLLLSPFSAPDPIIRLCRRKAAEVFARAARRHGCIFIDTYHLLDAGDRRARWSRYYDRFHLNRVGHEKVGRLVAEGLHEAIVSRGTANVAVPRTPRAAGSAFGLTARAAH